MNARIFGKDWSLSWHSLGSLFWWLLFAGLAVGVLRALIEPQLKYVDIDWKVEPDLPTTLSTVAPSGNTNFRDDPIQRLPATTDPVTQLIRRATDPGGVLLPKLMLPIAQELAFSRFYIGNDLETCFCSGESWHQVHWSNRAYRCGGLFVDLTEPLSQLEPLKPLDTLNRLQQRGDFQSGPGPAVAGYEQLSSGGFRFAVGQLTDPVNRVSTLSYARNADWLSFPSKFAPTPANATGPWAIYQDEQVYPWLGVDYATNFPAGSLTATALTHQIDTDQFPIAWQGPLSTKEYEWLAGDTAWQLARKALVESYTNYQHGLVVAAFQLPSDQSVLLLYSAHSGKVLAVNPLPLGGRNTKGVGIERLQFSPNGWWLAAYDNAGELYFFDTKTLQLLRHYPQTDGRDSRQKTVRMAFNSRGDRFIAPGRDGDLLEVSFLENRLQRLGCTLPVNAFAYATSYDDVDTLMTVSTKSGLITKYRLDQGTAAREAKFLLAGLYPQATFLNFSETGSLLCGVVSEATAAWHEAPVGKLIHETESRLLVWDFSLAGSLGPVPRSPQSWPLRGGGLVGGNFVQLVTASDGFHVLINNPQQGLVDIPATELASEALDRAILLSSVVRAPVETRGGVQ